MANIQAVAKRAGVSISTVSRVLNGSAHVNHDLKVRVHAAIRELEYRPNSAARSLRANHSTIIGLLIPDIQNPFFMGLIQGVEDVAQRNRYSLILCNSDESPEREQQYLDVLYHERIAGAIIVPTQEQLSNLTRFRERNIPIVAVDRRIKDNHIDAVLVDNVRGAREAVTHLIENGYRRIGVITGPQTLTTGRERLEGYRQALQEAGLPLDPLLERSGSFKGDNAQQLANELLDLDPPIDALFAGSSLLTLGALLALYARNLRIPDDIALVGYGELPWTAFASIPLTTVIQPVYELGATAAQQLFQHLQDPTAQAGQEIILAPNLCIHGSSSPRDRLPDTIPAS